MRLTVGDPISAENWASRNTVKPSFRLSWNQSRQVTRLPDQLWKYSWATMASIRWKVASVAVSWLASTQDELKIFRPLFSMARSEERRVGKECRSRWAAYDLKSRDHGE